MLFRDIMKPVVAHSVDIYLPITCHWIYCQLLNVKRFETVVVARQKQNLDLFPLSNVYSLEDFSEIGEFVQKVRRKLRNSHYPFWEKVLRKRNAKLLHSHFGNRGYHNLGLAKRLKIPHIASFYGFDLNMLPQRDPVWKERYQTLFNECDLFLVEGNHAKKYLVDMGCSEEKIVVQHLGVNLEDIEFVPRETNGTGTINILVAGSFREKKGIPFALEAFGLMREKHKNLRMVLIGDSSGIPREEAEKKKISEVIKRRGLNDSIKMLGFVPYSELMAEASRCHIFLSPSIQASDGDTEGGAPVTILEMSASGMPVLSTFHCDIPGTVLNGKSGFLVPEKDVGALAEKLDYLISNPKIWIEFGKSGRDHTARNYNSKIQAKKLEAIYDKLLSRFSSGLQSNLL